LISWQTPPSDSTRSKRNRNGQGTIAVVDFVRLATGGNWIRALGPPSNSCRFDTVLVASLPVPIPKAAKDVAVAQDYLKYLIRPPVLNEWLKTGLGRNAPNMPSIV